MFIPRYSIRTIFLIMAGLAVVFLLAGMGIRGHLWAGAVAVGIGSLVFVALSHAALFSLCWVFAGRKPQKKPQRHAAHRPSAQDMPAQMPTGSTNRTETTAGESGP